MHITLSEFHKDWLGLESFLLKIKMFTQILCWNLLWWKSEWWWNYL